MSKYFKDAEFRRCTPSCSIDQMDPGFMNKLDEVREIAGIPIVLTSAWRSIIWEKMHGRSGDGDHPQGRGVDVKCNTSQNRYKIVRAALIVGFRRIGIGKTFIHLGDATNLPQDVIWDYYE
ncbi:MAG: hypothetical protein J5639_09370 [Bacteroidales bacterium]|nr:hypothetical protein [Bacteroidales bacterium]